MRLKLPVCLVLVCITTAMAGPAPLTARENLDGTIEAGGQVFSSWSDYVGSELFRDSGLRCATPERPKVTSIAAGSPSDCSLGFTNPAAIYDAATGRYRVQVVVHVIQNTSGSGNVSPAAVASQIEILNEDFLALPGTNGENGTPTGIEFALATVDPTGQPTTGITYSTNNSWFNDSGSYWTALAWDTTRYLNIYTNSASGALGYVPALPQSGLAGTLSDRVVILWAAFGANAPIGPPFNQGRTTTHEVGHWLGLDHTFAGGCANQGACHQNGDLICDTNPQVEPTSGCFDSMSCGVPGPYLNYMDYSDDLCYEEFTFEQARRMRCTVEHYRPAAYAVVNACGNGALETGEECDDANTTPGDGCNATCQLEIPAPLEVSPPGTAAPLKFVDRITLQWAPASESGATSFNLYRGTLTGLASGDYGSCLISGFTANQAFDVTSPAPGTGRTYLVTGSNEGGEGSAGTTSSGAPRTILTPCD